MWRLRKVAEPEKRLENIRPTDLFTVYVQQQYCMSTIVSETAFVDVHVCMRRAVGVIGRLRHREKYCSSSD